MAVEMDLDGFLRNCKGDLDMTLRKLKEILADNNIEFVDDKDDDGEASKLIRWIRGLYKDTSFLVDTIKYNLKNWEAERDALLHPKPIPASEYHEDMGPVLWWRFPIEEPPKVTCPLTLDWEDGYYTHFTKLAVPHQMTKEEAENV